MPKVATDSINFIISDIQMFNMVRNFQQFFKKNAVNQFLCSSLLGWSYCQSNEKFHIKCLAGGKSGCWYSVKVVRWSRRFIQIITKIEWKGNLRLDCFYKGFFMWISVFLDRRESRLKKSSLLNRIYQFIVCDKSPESLI